MSRRDELLGLLNAAAGEESLHSAIGYWRQRVSELVGDAIDIATTALNTAAGGGVVPAALRLFSQVGYVTTEAGPPPNGPGQVGLVDNTDIVFNAAPYGALPYAGGVFTLEAGKSYRLSANLQLGYSDPDGFATIYWVDAANNIIRPGVGDLVDTAYDNAGGSFSGIGSAELLYTPSAAQGVKLRVIEITAGTVDILYGSNALVHEI